MMAPRSLTTMESYVDVTAAMAEQTRSRAVTLKVVAAEAELGDSRRPDDPFAGVEV